MKKLLLSLLLSTSACIQSASALTITIDSTLTDFDTLVFDIEWSPLPPLGPLFSPVAFGGGHAVAVVDSVAKITALVVAGPFALSQHNLQVPSAPRTFGSSTSIQIVGGAPSSITGSPEGFTARFVYGNLPAESQSNSVPDGGSGMALLGLTMVGTVGFRKFVAR